MQLRQWIEQKRLSFKIGLSLGLLHFVFSLFVAHHVIVWSQNAQWQFFWALPFAIE